MMDSCKVQLAGGSTYTVSLPKQWARDHGVDAGSEVAIRSHGDGTLLVQVDPSGGDDDRPSVAVDRHDDVSLSRLVTALYAAGHDEFALLGERTGEPAALRAVERTVSELVGLTLAEAGDGTLAFRNALDPDDVSVPQTVMQLRRTACGAFEDAVTISVTGEEGPGDAVVGRAADAERLFGVVDRSFRRSLVDVQEVDRLGVDRPALFELHGAAHELARVGEAATQVARMARTDASPLESDVAAEGQARAEAAVALVDDAVSTLLDGSDLDAATALVGRHETLSETLDHLVTAVDDDSGTCCRTIQLLQRTATVADAGGAIAEAAIQRTLREE